MTWQPAGHTLSSLSGTAEAPALLDDHSQTWLTYGQLEEQVSAFAAKLPAAKSLALLYLRNDINSVVAFLGALRAGHAVALLDADLPTASKLKLEQLYCPEVTISVPLEGVPNVVCSARQNGDIHPDLAVLLSTSGSTGDPKFVRLTEENISSNASAIGKALSITAESVAAAHLPLHYSYGLSVLTSHLAAGAAVLLTQKGFMDRDFWPLIKTHKISHFPGVPFHFEMMNRLGFHRLGLDAVNTLTQAGGRLDTKIKHAAYAFMKSAGGKFCVMYGQTEAAPRITTLSHADFADHSSSVGPALEGGTLQIRDENGFAVDPGKEGHVYYHGPNVMMGYAANRADLANGDELQSWLDTGDIGFLDNQGRLTLTGRSGRMGKVYGLRVNLDAIEKLAQTVCGAAILQKDNSVVTFHTGDDTVQAAMLDLYKKHFTLPFMAYKFVAMGELPTTERGKLDYRALEATL